MRGRLGRKIRLRASVGRSSRFSSIVSPASPIPVFNGNTFGIIGRELALAIFSDLPPVRKREISSAFGHYISGLLDKESLSRIVEALSTAAYLKPGDRVKTFRDTSRGVIVRILEDGRVIWRADSSDAELIALPESLIPEK